MKLTEDDFYCDYGDAGGLLFDKETIQQILDDYEKARKWDYMVDNGLTTEQLNQELRLTELIEKRIGELKQIHIIEKDWNIAIVELQKLLEESEK